MTPLNFFLKFDFGFIPFLNLYIYISNLYFYMHHLL